MRMRVERKRTAVLIILVGTLFLLAAPSNPAQTAESRLATQSDQFRRQLIKVTDNVHVAVGFGLANSILIEGNDGVVIVDAMESDAAARDVKAAFDTVTRKPVLAIIYTHNHRDHTLGSDVLAGGGRPAVYANVRFAQEELGNSPVRAAIAARSRRQFGAALAAADRPNLGIGPELRINYAGGDAFLEPTITFDNELSVTVAGVRVRLVHAPGETDDQLYVVLPDKGVLMPGDNYYHAFPNLYAIRGAPYRNVRTWAASLSKMITEDAEYLVPSHTGPVIGRREVRERLTNYRDAVTFVYQATIDGINAGKTPSEIVQGVRLPERMSALPYLQEFYGTVPWAVRAIFAGELGWYSGNPTDLFPLQERERGRRIVDLVGGVPQLLDKVQRAVQVADYQWAAELVDHVLAIEPTHREARELKARALEVLARQQTSANARNYYLSVALDLRRPQ